MPRRSSRPPRGRRCARAGEDRGSAVAPHAASGPQPADSARNLGDLRDQGALRGVRHRRGRRRAPRQEAHRGAGRAGPRGARTCSRHPPRTGRASRSSPEPPARARPKDQAYPSRQRGLSAPEPYQASARSWRPRSRRRFRMPPIPERTSVRRVAGARAPSELDRREGRLGSISKQGNTYLRRLLIVGANAVMRWSKRAQTDPWFTGLRVRKPFRGRRRARQQDRQDRLGRDGERRNLSRTGRCLSGCALTSLQGNERDGSRSNALAWR